MKKFTKSILSLFLAVILLLAPVTAFAAGELGAEDNPYQVAIAGLDARPTNINVPANSSVWVQAKSGTSTFIIGQATSADYKIEYGGRTLYPESSATNELYFGITNANDKFKVTNTSNERIILYTKLEAGEYVDPTGTIDKPEKVTLSPNIFGAIGATATKVLALNSAAYHFMTTAEADGVVSVIITAYDNLEDLNPIGWSYNLSNKTQSISGGIHYSDEDEPVYHEEIDVKAGDEVIVAVSTYDPENPHVNPEGVVSVQFGFSPIGSMNVPEEVTLAPNLYGAIGATVTKELEKGNQGYHFMTKATADGKLAAIITAYDNLEDYNPIGWSYNINNVTQGIYGDTHWSDEDEPVFYEEWYVNEGDEFVVMVSTYDPNSYVNPEGVVSVQFMFSPLGSANCPEEIEETGHKSTELAANNDGYYYTWTATEDCTATFGIDTEASANWQYLINAEKADGSYLYGDTHWFDDDPAEPTQMYELKAGDTLNIFVATYKPNSFNNPKGTICWYLDVKTTPQFAYGDVDGNDRVTIGDVLLVRKYIAGLADVDETIADVDGNGRVTIGDVLLVRKYIAGLIDAFPVEE